MINIFENISIDVRSVEDNKVGVYLLTPEESLCEMIATTKGSRVMNPTFGSEFYKLVDKNIDDLWILRAKKMILECTTNPINDELWDDRADIKKLTIEVIDNKVNIGVQL